MDMSSNALSADARCVERLPYAFAKRHGVISARQLEQGIELWVRPGVKASVPPRCSARADRSPSPLPKPSPRR
jgi:hypothetical protein